MNFFLPVGLIRSPIITGLGPISTACEKEVTTEIFFFTGGSIGKSLTNSIVLDRYSGVVPQHPPSTCTFNEAISFISDANSSALIS